jgi:BASS family bile acid:Na+ symporter
LYDSLLLLDSVRLNFSDGGLLFMNLAIGFIMFGVAIDLRKEQFTAIFKSPKPIIVGLIAQFVLLPIVTFLAIWLGKGFITPGVAFGCILVAACPGGNVSNFITNFSKGNTALAVTLTAIGTVLAIVMTPFNFQLYGYLYMKASPLNVPIEIDVWDVGRTVLILLGIPIVLGVFVAHRWPGFVARIKKGVSVASLIIFVGFIVIAFRNNYEYFLKYIHFIFLIVLVHNALIFVSSYWLGRGLRLNRLDCRTVSIENAIQNSGLGLALIFNPKIFPPELQIGGMAFIAAWWGIWHIFAGMGVATWWRFHPLKVK